MTKSEQARADRLVRLLAGSCERKVRYKSLRETILVIERSRGRLTDVEGYRCRFCGGFHIGHPRPGTQEKALDDLAIGVAP